MRLVPFAALATFAMIAAACGSDFQDEPVRGGGASGTGGTSGTGGASGSEGGSGGSAGQPPEDASVSDGESGSAGSSGSSAGAAGQPPDAGAEDGSAGDGGACPSGYGDCDDDPSNGCETALDTELNCGACDKACLTDQLCINALCQLSCGAGTGDCDEDPATGCETDTTSALDHCGACGEPCGADNGTPDCVDSACTIDCDFGWDDCDDDRANGCEVATATDAAHCGSCGNTCPGAAHATATCVAGGCGLQCEAGWDDCDGNPSNGCEVNLTSDEDHCGVCSKACVGQQACVNSICQLSCSAPMGDCDGDPVTGCETNVSSNPAHCSACGNACPSGGHGTPTCTNSVCGIACTTGWANCDGGLTNGCEVNTLVSATNCGGCGTVCPTGANGTPSCTNGTCGIACSTGWGNCDGSFTNGCEVNITQTVSHCGACGNACPARTHATTTCVGSTCGYTCVSGWGDCDGSAANGCEVNTTQTVSHCGSCGNVCPTPAHATATCASSKCGYTCTTGWGDCNGSQSDGCETNLNSSTSHCGGCNAACSTNNGTAACANGTCAISCTSGYADCDGVNANGCEANLSNNADHCGACGHDCQGGTCSNGVCQAWVLATVAAEPRNLAVSSTHVFWTTPSAVQGIPRSGGALVNLATGQPDPNGITVDDTHVYFTNRNETGNVMRVEPSGGALTTIVAAESPGYIAVDQDSIYFGDGVAVRRRSKTNSFSTYVAAQATRNPGRISVDSQYVYFFSPGYSDGWVGRDSIAATNDPLTLASGLRVPIDMAADSTHLYYVQGNVNGVTRVPKAGGTKTTYGDAHVSAVAVDDAHVFYSEDDNGRVMQVAKAGGTPVVRRSGASTPYKIEVRDGVVYWIERGTYQILAMVK